MNIIYFDWIVFGLLYSSFTILKNITFSSITSYKYEVDCFWITVGNKGTQNIAKQRHITHNQSTSYIQIELFWCSLH